MSNDDAADDVVARRVLVPDLGDELTEVLRQVEELLLTLAAWEEEPDGPGPFVLPAPLAGCPPRWPGAAHSTRCAGSRTSSPPPRPRRRCSTTVRRSGRGW